MAGTRKVDTPEFKLAAVKMITEQEGNNILDAQGQFG